MVTLTLSRAAPPPIFLLGFYVVAAIHPGNVTNSIQASQKMGKVLAHSMIYSSTSCGRETGDISLLATGTFMGRANVATSQNKYLVISIGSCAKDPSSTWKDDLRSAVNTGASVFVTPCNSHLSSTNTTGDIGSTASVTLTNKILSAAVRESVTCNTGNSATTCVTGTTVNPMTPWDKDTWGAQNTVDTEKMAWSSFNCMNDTIIMECSGGGATNLYPYNGGSSLTNGGVVWGFKPINSTGLVIFVTSSTRPQWDTGLTNPKLSWPGWSTVVLGISNKFLPNQNCNQSTYTDFTYPQL